MLNPIWNWCAMHLGRMVEERWDWHSTWGPSRWMLLGAGSKRPRATDLAYVNARTDPVDHLTRRTFLPCSQITGMALVLQPRLDDPTDHVWLYDATTLMGKWSARMVHTKVTRAGVERHSKHWRLARVMRFDHPMAAPWYLQGMPCPLVSYGSQGSRLLRSVRYRIKHHLYMWC